MPTRDAVRATVYIDGDDAGSGLSPIECTVSSGMHQRDHALLQVNPKSIGYVEGIGVGQGSNATIEIVDGNHVYFWGKVVKRRIVITPEGESLFMYARVEPWHFGKPIVGEIHFNDIDEDHQVVSVERLRFNPILDGQIKYNQRSDEQYGDGDIYVFIDPEYLDRQPSEIEDDEISQHWDLADVVDYLCWVGNPDQTNFKNPDFDDLTELFDDDKDLVRNLWLPNGLYLPEALDKVLEPFGYTWHVNLEERGNRKIEVFKRGLGLGAINIRLQEPGSQIDTTDSDLVSCDIEYDLSPTVNQVHGLGGFVEIESTFDLLKGWSAAEDTHLEDVTKLTRTHPDFVSTYKNIGRLWVLNEGGDYDDVREDYFTYDFSEMVNAVIAAADGGESDSGDGDQDQEHEEEKIIPGRRRFWPTLTINDRGRPIGPINGYRVQYRDPNISTADGASQWVDYNGEVHIKDDECGIYFEGLHPPDEITRFGNSMEVRITATVRIPLRIGKTVAKQSGSPLGDVNELVLDLSHRFRFRQVHEDSVYHDHATLEALEDDDRPDLEAYCDDIRAAYDIASVNGVIELEGADRTGYKVGQSVVGIQGRGVNFTASQGADAFPQIMALTTNFQRQRTTLHLDQYRAKRKYLVDQQGIEPDRKYNRRS